MSLSEHYRAQFGAHRGDRILLCLATAVAFHAGAATAGWLAWQDQQRAIAQVPQTQPIEFIYVEAEDLTTPDPQRLAQSESWASGAFRSDAPVNAGKTDPDPYKATLAEPKVVEGASAPPPSEMLPAYHASPGDSEAGAGAIAPTPHAPTPNDAAKVTEPLVPAPFDAASIPVLESRSDTEILLPTPPVAAAEAIGSTAPPDSPLGLPPTSAPSTDLSPALNSEIADSEIADSEAADSEAANQPVVADPLPETSPSAVAVATGLDGLPNPDPNLQPNEPAQIAAQRDQALGGYMAQLNEQIEAAWAPVEVQQTYEPIVRFVINREGTLLEAAISHPSESAEADAVALAAVHLAAPFAPLPTLIDRNQLVINFTFRYTLSTPATATTPSGS